MSGVTVRSLALLGVLALGVSGCSGEEPLLDDGTQGLPLAGLSAELDDAGVDVLAADRPADATGDEVGRALEDADVASVVVTRPADVADGAVAFDPTGTAGLLSVVTDGPGETVVLVFASPDAAAVFAGGDPDVFTDQASQADHDAFLSGNLVGYAGPGGTRSDDLREALESLAGPAGDSTSGTSPASPTTS